MTKKLLYTLMGFTFSVFQITNAQVCSPGPQTTPGIYPDSIVGLSCGIKNTPYIEILTMVVPTDTVDPFCTCGVELDSISLTGIANLPPGLNYTCDVPSCSWPGGSNGCVLIDGTPTDTGTYDIIAYTKAFVKCKVDIGFGCGSPAIFDTASYDVIDFYSIDIASDSTTCTPTGIADIETSKFIINKNSPNPFTEKTKIFFNSPAISDVKFIVYNMLGKLVYSENLKAKQGINMIQFYSKDMPAGVYMYSLNSDNHIVTRRMVVAGK
ncbi:MAG: T9SS type A sorting domain-containing protein [Bacteroidota bacterium]